MVKNRIRQHVRIRHISHELCHLQVQGGERQDTSNFVFSYVPPTTKTEEVARAQRKFREVQKIVQDIPEDQETYIMGDFNARMHTWQNPIINTDTVDNEECGMSSADMIICPTRESQDEGAANLNTPLLRELCEQNDLLMLNGTGSGNILGAYM